MQISEYVRFREHLGDSITWLDDVPFARYRRWFYTSLPRVRQYVIGPEQLRSLLFKGALGVIATSAENTKRSLRYMVCRGPEYDMSRLSSRNRRTQTRQGLGRCEIRPVPWDEMAAKGLSINREALLRQQRGFSYLVDAEWWKQQCLSSAPFPDVRAWGAYVEHDLASYVHVIIHDWVEADGTSRRVGDIIHFMSGNAHLRDHPNEALIYSVTRTLICDLHCDAVVIGTTSNDPHLYEWKHRMGFRPEETGYHMVVNPALHIAKFFIPKLRLWVDGVEYDNQVRSVGQEGSAGFAAPDLKKGKITTGMQSA
jgi:hypothetical protein